METLLSQPQPHNPKGLFGPGHHLRKLRNKARESFFERFKALGEEDLMTLMPKLNVDDLGKLELIISRAVIGDFDSTKVVLDETVKEVHYIPRPTYKAPAPNEHARVSVVTT